MEVKKTNVVPMFYGVEDMEKKIKKPSKKEIPDNNPSSNTHTITIDARNVREFADIVDTINKPPSA